VLSRTVYDNNPNNVTVGMTLPPNCTGGCGNAIVNGSYPYVCNNVSADANFSVTSKIFLDQSTPAGALINSLEAPNSSQNARPPNQTVTSFSSKSELALNLSTGNDYLTLMGYVAPIDALDVPNSNAAGLVDPTNPVGGSYYRVVAQVDQKRKVPFHGGQRLERR